MSVSVVVGDSLVRGVAEELETLTLTHLGVISLNFFVSYDI